MGIIATGVLLVAGYYICVLLYMAIACLIAVTKPLRYKEIVTTKRIMIVNLLTLIILMIVYIAIPVVIVHYDSSREVDECQRNQTPQAIAVSLTMVAFSFVLAKPLTVLLVLLKHAADLKGPRIVVPTCPSKFT